MVYTKVKGQQGLPNWLNCNFFFVSNTMWPLKNVKVSKLSIWVNSSWQSIDVLIDEIGRPSCWPSILSPWKSYTPCWTKMSQMSKSSDLVHRYVKMSVMSIRIKICNHIFYILTFFKAPKWPSVFTVPLNLINTQS